MARKRVIEIDKSKLGALLNGKRNRLETPIMAGVVMILAANIMMLTVRYSDFNEVVLVTLGAWVPWVVYGISVLQFLYGIYLIYLSVRKYSVDELIQDICSCAPDDSDEYLINVILIRNKLNRNSYLMHKIDGGECYLFPAFKITAEEFVKKTQEDNVRAVIQDEITDVDSSLKLTYLGDLASRKYSVRDKVVKKYHYHFWIANPEALDLPWRNRPLLGNIKTKDQYYRWMTLEEMNKDANIQVRNADVYAKICAFSLND